MTRRPSARAGERYQQIIDGLTAELEAAHEKIAALVEQRGRQESARFTEEVIESSARLDGLLHLLTKREREVARLFMRCANDKLVASHLGIAAQTVRNQLASIQNKLDVRSREELILFLVSSKRVQALDRP